MIDDKVFQTIIDEIISYFPENWKETVVYFEYGKASYTIDFFVKVNDEWVKCYDIPDISDKKLEKSFSKIDACVSKMCRCGKDKWSTMTLTIERDGNFRSFMDYTDLSEGNYTYRKEWKKKYLL